MISGTFSCTQDDRVVFYNANFEQELLDTFGLEAMSSCSSPSAVMNSSSPTAFDDPCYFLEYAEPANYFLDFTDAPTPPPVEVEFTDVKPRVSEQVPAVQVVPLPPKQYQPSEAQARFAPYPEPSGQEQTKRKRGRPMKSSSDTKMANYSRQYRELKKAQLAVSESRASALERENEELRAQLQEVLSSHRRLEAEVEDLRHQMNYARPYHAYQDVPVQMNQPSWESRSAPV